jgi:alkylhydroperoxidase/carboxymuconolactone decarboxylase family protein YurZ
MWTRNVLDDRTRRLLVLAMTIALGRWEEFELHVKAGLAADLSNGDWVKVDADNGIVEITKKVRA